MCIVADVFDKRYSQSLSDGLGVADAYSMDGTELSDERACVVCLCAPVETCFIPCGHVACCKACSTALGDQKCPVCRGAISNVQAIFLV